MDGNDLYLTPLQIALFPFSRYSVRAELNQSEKRPVCDGVKYKRAGDGGGIPLQSPDETDYFDYSDCV